MANSELLKRSITGLFIVGFTLAAVIYSAYSYLLFLAFINFFGSYEFLMLQKEEHSRSYAIVISFVFSFMLVFAGWWMMQAGNPLLSLVAIPVVISILILINLYQQQWPAEVVQKNKSIYLSVIYTSLPLLTGCLFLFPRYSFHFILLPVILIWINDVGAYLIGSRFGKNKIKPEISPGKSLQGTIGGFVFTFLGAFILMNVWPDLPKGYLISLAVATPLFALGGDLWESALKREAGVKDSGQIFPGHGGVLDRYDSFIFVLPVAALAYFIFAL